MALEVARLFRPARASACRSWRSVPSDRAAAYVPPEECEASLPPASAGRLDRAGNGGGPGLRPWAIIASHQVESGPLRSGQIAACTPPVPQCSRRSTEAGVDCLFANFGSDHTALIEAMAAAREQRRAVRGSSPRRRDGRHVGRARSRAAERACAGRARTRRVRHAVARRAPSTTPRRAACRCSSSPARRPPRRRASSRGSRNEFIQWIQDVPDQRGLVRGYVSYDHEIRFGANAKQIVHRALQIAHSDPRGPGVPDGEPRSARGGDRAGRHPTRALARRWRRRP